MKNGELVYNSGVDPTTLGLIIGALGLLAGFGAWLWPRSPHTPPAALADPPVPPAQIAAPTSHPAAALPPFVVKLSQGMLAYGPKLSDVQFIIQATCTTPRPLRLVGGRIQGGRFLEDACSRISRIESSVTLCTSRDGDAYRLDSC